MKWLLLLIFVWLFIFIVYTFVKGYPERGWFKWLLHDKLNMHSPDFNYVEYDEKSKIADMYCKYCNKQMRYFNICKYTASHKPENIPNVALDSYCHECQRKNYTNEHNCCPHECKEFSPCSHCERDWNDE